MPDNPIHSENVRVTRHCTRIGRVPGCPFICNKGTFGLNHQDIDIDIDINIDIDIAFREGSPLAHFDGLEVLKDLRVPGL